jgi:hypothetical protein
MTTSWDRLLLLLPMTTNWFPPYWSHHDKISVEQMNQLQSIIAGFGQSSSSIDQAGKGSTPLAYKKKTWNFRRWKVSWLTFSLLLIDGFGNRL